MPSLTERKLLQMPASAYMNPEQLAFFKALLLQQLEEIQAELDSARQDIANASQTSPDELDRAVTEEENRQRLRFTERKYLLLRKIRQALDRIDDGSYGYCEATGDPIGLQRLLLRPTAELCFEEKSRREQQERNYVKQRS